MTIGGPRRERIAARRRKRWVARPVVEGPVFEDLDIVAPGVLVPDDGQLVPSRAKWVAAGFEPIVRAGSPDDLAAAFLADRDQTAGWPVLIVLDYVGHPDSSVEAARRASPVPIVDLGALAPTVVAATMRR